MRRKKGGQTFTAVINPSDRAYAVRDLAPRGAKILYAQNASVEDGAPAFLRVSEESRRMADMLRMYTRGGESELPVGEELVVNLKNRYVEALLNRLSDGEKEPTCTLAAKQIYMSALLLARNLTEPEQKMFAELSDGLLGTLIP